MTESPIPLARYAAIPSGQMQFIQPEARYPTPPPALFDFRCTSPDMARAFLAVLARGEVAAPAEAVMLFPDAFVLDGRYVVAREGIAVQESFADTSAHTVLVARHPGRMDRIAAGEVATLPAAGPPVVAIFKEWSEFYGHVLGEVLPKLVHLAAMGLREMRLLLPANAEALRPVIGFALKALGLSAEFVICPENTVLRVPALHWVSPVSEYNLRLSPTLPRLMAALRQAAPPPDGPARLFAIRPDEARRRLTNAAEVTAAAERAGFTVVDPAALDFPDQVALFAGAGWVAGPWGSHLTLSGAMAPGGRVTMFDPATGDFFFWDIACLAGQRFDWAFTRPLEPGRFEVLDRDMAIGADLLDAVLEGA